MQTNAPDPIHECACIITHLIVSKPYTLYQTQRWLNVVPETHRAHSEFVFVRAIATTPHKLYNSKRQVKRQAIRTQPKISASLAKISANLSAKRSKSWQQISASFVKISANLSARRSKYWQKISASLAKISARFLTITQNLSKYRPTNANVPCDINIDIASLGRDLLKLSKK